MRQWLPWLFLALLVLLLAAAPWRRVDPKHEFMVNLLNRLGTEDPADQITPHQGRTETLGYRTHPGRNHGLRSTDV